MLFLTPHSMVACPRLNQFAACLGYCYEPQFSLWVTNTSQLFQTCTNNESAVAADAAAATSASCPFFTRVTKAGDGGVATEAKFQVHVCSALAWHRCTARLQEIVKAWRASADSTTVAPTASPTLDPTTLPTSFPTLVPTETGQYSSLRPSIAPTASPTLDPTTLPTSFPTLGPTEADQYSSLKPSIAPTDAPTMTPSLEPSGIAVDASTCKRMHAHIYINIHMRTFSKAHLCDVWLS